MLRKLIAITNFKPHTDERLVKTRSIYVHILNDQLPFSCASLSSLCLDYTEEIIKKLTKIMADENYLLEDYTWGSEIAYVTSWTTHSEAEVFSKKYLNIDNQELLEWLKCRRDFLIYIQEKKTMVALLREAFYAIVANPKNYPGLNEIIEGRHTYIHKDIEITIQFSLERNEYSLTFEEFLAQIPQLRDNGESYWVYR